MNAETGAGGGYSFRNPPKFHSFLRPSIRDAAYETEALLEHLFYHKNVARPRCAAPGWPRRSRSQ